jgi:glycerol uptake facilitator-like aquaporin
MWPQFYFLISKFGDFFSEETGTFPFIFLFFAFWRKENAKKTLVHIYMVIFVDGFD